MFRGSVAGDAEEGGVDPEVGRRVDRGQDLNGDVEAGREVDHRADQRRLLKFNLSPIKIEAPGAAASQIFLSC